MQGQGRGEGDVGDSLHIRTTSNFKSIHVPSMFFWVLVGGCLLVSTFFRKQVPTGLSRARTSFRLYVHHFPIEVSLEDTVGRSGGARGGFRNATT